MQNVPCAAIYKDDLTYKSIKLWIIDDVDVVTVLLPEDY